MNALPKNSWFFKVLAPFLLVAIFFLAPFARTQESSAPPPAAAPGAKTTAEFSAAADEVLQQMSEITGLKSLTPLKKTLRSREEIRSYILKQMNEDKGPAERYAGTRSAEAFGLLPQAFDMDTFMVNVLTEQVVGLYDPKAHEFYIADWSPLSEQRMVMAHELTHALEDQHFEIESWLRAARPNDDAELAREAVLEGSAMASMIDYMLLGTGHSVKDLPEVDPASMMGDMGNSPTLQTAPPFLKDSLVFPYFAGLSFSVAILKPAGWSGFPKIFSKPPASTQQIMHPALYFAGKTTPAVTLPSIEKSLGSDWAKLEENNMGEFGWKEVLKQFLGDDRAKPLAAAWDGDRYSVYERKSSKQLVLLSRLRLSTAEQMARFFGQYSEALEKKHTKRSNLLRRVNFFSFDTSDGSVFLYCVNSECLTLEGADRKTFDGVTKSISWPPAPTAAARPDDAPSTTTANPYSNERLYVESAHRVF